MFILHWEYMSGSIVAHAMLLETQATFELNYVDMARDTHKQKDYLRLNPAGRVPALSLPGGTTIGETGAIVTYLGETFPEAGLTPQPGDADRATFLFWLNVMATAGYPTVARWNHPYRYAQTAEASAEVEQKATADLDAFYETMEGAIEGHGTVLERGFSALDYYLAMLTEWYSDRPALFARHPKIAEVYRNAARRPAYQTAMTQHALPEAA